MGFIGFGEVASTITSWLRGSDINILTSLENRGSLTVKRAKDMGVGLLETKIELAACCDVLISSVTPSQALDVAKEVGGHVNGIYVDVNNISPEKVKEALSFIENGKTVDAAIMGSVKKEPKQVHIVASGNCGEEFAELNKYGLNIRFIGQELGQAKTLKMLRSQYTKLVSALLLESFTTAYRLGLDEELMDYLEITEGPQFRRSAQSRMRNSTIHAQRRTEELDEIIDFQNSLNNADKEFKEMVKVTRDMFSQIKANFPGNEIPAKYRDILKVLSEIM